MKVTLLGTGTSQGVPLIACECHVCKSTDSKDKRLRCALLISDSGENFVIDSGPDFRQQMLRESVKSLSGILFTHEHKDHLAGLDDVRAFNHKDKKPMEIYCDTNVQTALQREFHYVFQENSYPGIPKLNINIINKNKFTLPNGLEIQPIEALHYKLPVLGFRFNNFTYLTDAKTVSEEEREKIRGSKTLIINCLHEYEHVSHFNLKEVLEFIEDVKPEKTYLTHISHYFGTHEEITKKLPANVFPAYDGLSFEI
ncbi:MAG: MBL fold metallo-hydrolase [Bacteroidota bacterium]